MTTNEAATICRNVAMGKDIKLKINNTYLQDVVCYLDTAHKQNFGVLTQWDSNGDKYHLMTVKSIKTNTEYVVGIEELEVME